MKFSLLIQGPILSIGKTNINLKVGETNDKFINFQSENYIYENIKRYGSLFDKIIISTWSSENIYKLKALIKTFENVKIVQFDDIYKGIYQKKFNNSKLAININNKLKMFNGINNSLTHFDSNEVIIRIRTDQKVDLDKIICELKKNKNSNKFYLPYLTGTGYFQDFYFAANKRLMQKFLGYYCKNYKEIELSPHYEFFYRIFIGMNFKNKFLLSASSISRQLISKIIEKRYFKALPYNVYSNILWRGNNIQINPKRKLFFSNDLNGYDTIIKINKKIRNNLLIFALLTPTKYFSNFKDKIGITYSIIFYFLTITKLSKINHYILSKI